MPLMVMELEVYLWARGEFCAVTHGHTAGSITPAASELYTNT